MFGSYSEDCPEASRFGFVARFRPNLFYGPHLLRSTVESNFVVDVHVGLVARNDVHSMATCDSAQGRKEKACRNRMDTSQSASFLTLAPAIALTNLSAWAWLTMYDRSRPDQRALGAISAVKIKAAKDFQTVNAWCLDSYFSFGVASGMN